MAEAESSATASPDLSNMRGRRRPLQDRLILLSPQIPLLARAPQLFRLGRLLTRWGRNPFPDRARSTVSRSTLDQEGLVGAMTGRRGRERRRHLLRDPATLILILISALVAFAVAAIAAREGGHTTLPLGWIALDAAAVAYLTAVLAVLQRRRILGGALALVIGNGLLIASCVKTALLGHPGAFVDLLLLPDLLRVLDPGPALAGCAALSALLGAYLVNLGTPRTFLERCLLVPLLTALVFAGLLAGSPSVARSAALALPYRSDRVYSYFHQAYIAYVHDVGFEHIRRALRASGVAPLQTAPLTRAVLPRFAPRNVHVVVAESFTDPAWYAGYGMAAAPMPPLFERWRDGPLSTALSPVFGGRSSNAEFEILCGTPAAVGPSEIVFWRLGSRPLPCLPRLLGEAGYQSISLVPSSPAIFNAGRAYRSIGFDHSVFEHQLDMSDRDGRFLSGEATLAQHLERIEPFLRAGPPLLSYVFVNANHYP
jgi:hypothetical protein